MNKSFIILGIVLIFLGLTWHVWSNLGLGQLPGDVHITKGNMTWYFPMMSSLCISIVLSLILRLIQQ